LIITYRLQVFHFVMANGEIIGNQVFGAIMGKEVCVVGWQCGYKYVEWIGNKETSA